MSDSQDPRNIFVNRRRQYTQPHPSDAPTDKRNATESGAQRPQTGAQQSAEQDYQRKVDEMKRLAAKYERQGEGQLVKDIVNNVIEQKARGNLTNEQLIAFANRVSPLLNDEQRGRLQGLLQQLLKL